MNRGSSFTLLALLLSLLALGALPLGAAENRAANIDVILLVDKSLSMAGAEGAVKVYLAGEVIGPILMPGDRLIIETFYGKIDRLFGGTIRSEEDKAGIVRSLNALKADGRFTDIGLALDRARADLDELASPERPKYVLLLTDERQEAPKGTKYYSATYTLEHPALQYVRRVDKGGFRAITVGFDVGQRVDAATPGVMRLLSEVPAREARDYPSLPPGTEAGLQGAANASVQGGPGTAAPAGTMAREAGKTSSRKGLGGIIPLAGMAGGVLLVLFLAGAVIRVVQLRLRRRKDQEDK